jgi:hypothetical protein
MRQSTLPLLLNSAHSQHSKKFGSTITTTEEDGDRPLLKQPQDFRYAFFNAKL